MPFFFTQGFFAARLGAATRSLRATAASCLAELLAASPSSPATPTHWLEQVALSPLRPQLTATLAPLVARAVRREDSPLHLAVGPPPVHFKHPF
jgi:hypothetical protein